MGIEEIMRTKEEAKFELDQDIYNLFDKGFKIKKIAQQLVIDEDYVFNLLKNTSLEG